MRNRAVIGKQNTFNKWAVMWCMLIFLLTAKPCGAVIVDSRIDYYGNFRSTEGIQVGNSYAGPVYDYACPILNFSSAAYYLDSIELVLGWSEQLPGDPYSTSVNVSFATNAPGGISGLPGMSLETVTVESPNSAGVVTANFSGTTLIAPNTRYWVWLSVVDPASATLWFYRDNLDIGLLMARSDDGGQSWIHDGERVPAIRINGSQVPLPSTILLLGTALAGLFGLRTTRNFRR